MSDAEIERLYRALTALQEEVKGYRDDLNGRLRRLERHRIESDTREEFRTASKKHMYATIIVVTAIVSTASALFAQVVGRI